MMVGVFDKQQFKGWQLASVPCCRMWSGNQVTFC